MSVTKTSVSVKHLPVSSIALALLCLGLTVPKEGQALQFQNTEVVPKITLSAEFNDNINLTHDASEDGMVYHIAPGIAVNHRFKDHTLYFDLNGDHRENSSNSDSVLNIKSRAGVDMNFAGGLSLGIWNLYDSREFDQEIHDLLQDNDINIPETNRTDYTSNTFNVNAAYTAVERMRIAAGYERDWEEWADIGDEGDVERNVDTFSGRLSMPLSREWLVYTAGSLRSQDSDQRPHLNYDASRYLLGAEWSGPNRFTFWGEAGYEKIDYDLGEAEDLSEFVAELGTRVRFTQRTNMEFALGRDGYGNMIYRGIFTHLPGRDDRLRLSLVKATQEQFLFTSVPTSYEATRISLSYRKALMERLTAGIEGGIQLQDFDTDDVSIWTCKATIGYSLRDWVTTGFHYQYSTKSSDRAENEYDNNRIGVFVTFFM
jgi:hypothetical protein